MNERLRDILVMSGIAILLMIGTYKCGRESIEERIEVSTKEYTETKIKPHVTDDEDNFDNDVENKKHYLIVGSYYNIEMAQHHVDSLFTQGFEPFIVEGDGYYRVSVFSSIYIDQVYSSKNKYVGQIDKMWVYSE